MSVVVDRLFALERYVFMNVVVRSIAYGGPSVRYIGIGVGHERLCGCRKDE